MSKTGTDDLPDPLKPFAFHGMDLTWQPGRTQATADCPFCGKEGKWFAGADDGLWDCKPCGRKGNPLGFVRELLKAAGRPDRKAIESLAADRGLLRPETLTDWGAVRSPLTGLWLLPGFNTDGAVVTCYKYARDPKRPGKRHLLATPGLHHGFFAPAGNPVPKVGLTLHIQEGPWDGMTLWESFLLHKPTDEGGWTRTGNPAASGLKDRAVIAVPGCNVWQPKWGKLTAGADVVLGFDSDHPKEHPEGSGRFSQPGLDGMRRIAAAVCGSATDRPAKVSWVRWGERGFDPDKPTGYDVRDHLNGGGGPDGARRGVNLTDLLGKVYPIPADWTAGATTKAGTPDATPVECKDWRTLRTAWRKALKWPETPLTGLEGGLVMMLSCIASTDVPGDQLWVKVVGPPSCGKSSLCEAVSTAARHVKAVSTLTGFHSGFKTDRAGEEDHSLLAQMNLKTLVLKDGDTLLNGANKDMVMSEARDIYDGVSRAFYRHGLERKAQLRMTWILCGTASLRALDTSELGQRFLDWEIMAGIDRALEVEVNLKRINGFFAMMAEVDASGAGGVSPEETTARRLTGGYVEWLRANVRRLVGEVSAGVPPDTAEFVSDLGQMVAFLRARPSRGQDEEVTRELSTRLCMQLSKLAVCAAVVLNKRTVDREVLRFVARSALCTARGRTMNLVEYLSRVGAEGAAVQSLGVWTGESEDKARTLLRFLKRIGAVESYKTPADQPNPGRVVYRLTDWMADVYRTSKAILDETPTED